MVMGDNKTSKQNWVETWSNIWNHHECKWWCFPCESQVSQLMFDKNNVDIRVQTQLKGLGHQDKVIFSKNYMWLVDSCVGI
jgi:predicted metalloprotease with PDZ domain